MKLKPVPLIRRFTEINGRYLDHDIQLDELWPHLARGGRLNWATLAELHRVVILADAGAGKTYEMAAEAKRLIDRNKIAFFIRIEDIDAEFGAAFEVGSHNLFQRWLSGTEEAWFFLDSVDEVRLETPRAFENAMRAFAARIHGARQRAHVFVSSRPYAWRPKADGALLNEILPFDPEKNEESGGTEGVKTSTTDADSLSPRIYRLAPLDEDDIRIFAGHRGIVDANPLIEALQKARLFSLAQLPFDLEDILAIWHEIGSLESRLDVLQQGLRRRLTPPDPKSLPLDRAMEGARRLALAVTLTNEASIRLPGTGGGGLDASAVLNDWAEADIRELLSRGVFSDAIYSMVRFRHRETRELLAAQWLAGTIHRSDRRSEVERLFFREIYGQEVIVPRLRPLLPWLILFDEGICSAALRLDPKISIESGDPSKLPIEIRRSILAEMAADVVEDQARGGDNSELARIAQADLDADVAALIEQHHANDDAIFFLGRLVWQGAMQEAAGALLPIALDEARGVYARLVSIRAIGSVIGGDSLKSIWLALNESGVAVSRQLLGEVLEQTPANLSSVELLIASLGFLEARQRHDHSDFPRTLHTFVDRLPVVADTVIEQPLARLIEGLADYLGRAPFVERKDCKVSQEFSWLMPIAIHAAERQIAGRSRLCLEPVALTVLSMAPTLRFWSPPEDRHHKSKLSEMVPRWAELNDALFWHTVSVARDALQAQNKRLVDDWEVTWIEHFWKFDSSSFSRTLEWISGRDLVDDRLVALARCFRTYAQNGRPRVWRRQLWAAVSGEEFLEERLRQLMRPPANPERRRWSSTRHKWADRHRKTEKLEATNRARWVAKLRADPDSVRNPAAVDAGQMSWDQLYLMESVSNDEGRFTRRGHANWRQLEAEFGSAVAEAYRDAALNHWRQYEPPDRPHDNTTPYTLVFGMVGLEMAAGEDFTGLAGLGPSDAERAFRYARWELNGFPRWLEPLYRAHPDIGLMKFWADVRWELERSSEETHHRMLHDVVYHAPWLHSALAPLIHEWVSTHVITAAEPLRYARSIMAGGKLEPLLFGELGMQKAMDSSTPPEQLPVWFATWITALPETGIPALESVLAGLDQPADARFAEQFIVALMGGRNEGGSGDGQWKTPNHLKSLYLLMMRHIRIAEDINRADGGVFSPNIRDDAQDARSRLFTLLAEVPGEQTYREIASLAEEHPEAGYRVYMRQQAHRRAVLDSDIRLSEPEAVELLGRLAG